MNTIDLDPSELNTVLQILQRYVPDHEVWAFGSRVTHTAKKFSDLDLVVMTQQPLAFSILGELQEAFSESNLSIKLDVLDWSRTDLDFQRWIEAQRVLLKR